MSPGMVWVTRQSTPIRFRDTFVLGRLAVVLVLTSGTARATCNVIPSVDRTFPSSEGEVSRPFARPGDVVAITRNEPVFSTDPAANAVLLTFRPLEADRIEIGPLPAA